MNFALFLFTALLWGGSFAAIQTSITSFSPLLAALLRVFIAALFLFILYPLLGKSLKIDRKDVPSVFLSGILSQGLPFALLFWAETRVNPGVAGLINGSVPLWTFVFATFFLKNSEKPTLQKLLGAITGLIGMIFIFAPQVLSIDQTNSIQTSSQWPYYLAVLIMAFSYAAGILYNRHLLSKKQIDPYTLAFHQPLGSSAFLAVLLILFEGNSSFDWTQVTPKAWGAVLYLAIFSTAIAFMIFMHLIRVWGAIRTGSVTYLMPLIALITDYLINRSIPESNEFVGGGLILLGLAIIQIPPDTFKLLKTSDFNLQKVKS